MDSLDKLRESRRAMAQWYTDRQRLALEIISAAESVVEASRDGLNHGAEIERLDKTVKAYDKFNDTHQSALEKAYPQ